MGRDWTRAFRKCPSVREYILLGEADDGSCAHNWFTWGNGDFAPGGNRAAIPPYKAEGFERIEVTL